jgi:hypothetical protein
MVLNGCNTKSILAIFSPCLPFAPWFFVLPCLDMFWVHVMHVLDSLRAWKVCNMLLGMLCEVMSIKHGRLWKKNVHGYHKTCVSITRRNNYEAKGKLREKVVAIFILLATFKTLANLTFSSAFNRNKDIFF